MKKVKHASTTKTKASEPKKALAADVLRNLVNLPFNEGYLKALVDYGHIEKVTFDEFMKLVIGRSRCLR